MKTCKACNVKVQTGKETCPLCGERLAPAGAANPAPPPNLYPDLSTRIASFNLLRRILIFITLFICGASVLINLLATPSFLWCLIVVAAALYAWLTVPPLLRRGQNFAARCVSSVILTSLLAVSLDFIIGYRGWSVDFVIPGLLIAGIAAIGLMMVFNRTNRAQYVLYQILLGVFGFVPLVLYFFDISNNMVMVLITATLALASLLGTIVFGDRTIKSEFKRRFHF